MECSSSGSSSSSSSSSTSFRFDYYEVLGVSRGASNQEVRRAYRSQAVRFHPDKNKEPGAEEHFKRVGRAYEVLGDPGRRLAYDLHGDESGSGGNDPFDVFMRLFSADDDEGDEGMNVFGKDFFEGFFGGCHEFGSSSHSFGGGGGGGIVDKEGSPSTTKDPDVVREVGVSLEELLTGVEKKMRLTRTVVDGKSLPVREERELSFKVPPGCEQGTRFVFRQMGDHFPGRTPADVVFVVKDRPHPAFVRGGGRAGGIGGPSDVVYSCDVAAAQVARGLMVSVPTLGGGPHVTFRCPQDSLAPGGCSVTGRLRGMGLPCARDVSGARGDLLVQFNVIF